MAFDMWPYCLESCGSCLIGCSMQLCNLSGLVVVDPYIRVLYRVMGFIYIYYIYIWKIPNVSSLFVYSDETFLAVFLLLCIGLLLVGCSR